MKVMPATHQLPVIFLHIPKTAGTTVHRLLDSEYRPEEVYTVLRQGERFADFTELPTAERAQIRMLKGHFHFGAHRALPQPARYFTILREPVERVISNYHFLCEHTELMLSGEVTARHRNLRDFAVNGGPLPTDNVQTRYLAGVGDEVPQGQCTEAMLAQARRNLREHFDFVGLMERFDETLVFLKRHYGWRFRAYGFRNTTKQRPRTVDLPAETRAAICASNALDLELYRQCAAEFAQRMQQLGPSFSAQVLLMRLSSRLLWHYRHPFRSLGHRHLAAAPSRP